MTVHCMVDLETLSTHSNAIILSIGAVAFDKDEGILDQFYVNIDADDCTNLGLHQEQATVDWWAQQDQAVWDALCVDAKPLYEALKAFSEFWRKNDCKYIWGNGADFDNVILKSAYNALDCDPPFSPFAGRCYRTIKKCHAAPEKDLRVGDHHNALDDALTQTFHLLKINRAISCL